MQEASLDTRSRPSLQTRAGVVDLDRVEGSVSRMAAAMRERAVALCPYARTHKSLEFGRRQLAAGAVGLTVATLGEAEVFDEYVVARGGRLVDRSPVDARGRNG